MKVRHALVLISLPLLAAQGTYNPRADLDEGRYLKVLSDADARIKQNHGDALAWAAKSQALSSLMRFGEATAAAQKSLELKPDLADGLLARGLARAGTAIQQRNLGSLRSASNAMDDFRAATRVDPNLASAWMSLGLAYEQLPGLLGGSTKKALACAEGLRRVRPSRGDLLQGLILSLDKRWTEAEAYFSRALATGGSDPLVVAGYLDALGSRETRSAIGETAQKTRLVQEARRLLPGVQNRAKGVEAVCDALLDGGQSEEAWKIAFGALSKVEAPSIVNLQLGKIAARSGLHLEEGLLQLDQVSAGRMEGGSGGTVALLWRRGQILVALGRPQEALVSAREALRLDPHHRGAQRLLKDISPTGS